MGYCNYGIHLSSGGVIGAQGNPTNSNSNTWSNTANYDLYTSVNTDGLLSPYFYYGYNPTTSSSCLSPIPTQQALNDYSGFCGCISLMAGMGFENLIVPNTENEMENIVNDEVDYTIYETESREISKQGVYKSLMNTDTVNISSELKTFVLEESDGDLGKIESLAQSFYAGDVIQANAANEAITGNEKTVAAIKDVNAILLNAPTDSVNNYYMFTAGELLALQNIAAQCPYEYGTAVFMARAALRSIDSTVYENECELPFVLMDNKSMEAGSNAENKFGLIIYPNPAHTLLHIDCDQTFGMQVEMYNYTGKLVYMATFNELKNTINLDKLSSGLYTLRILSNNLQIRTEKITIIN